MTEVDAVPVQTTVGHAYQMSVICGKRKPKKTVSHYFRRDADMLMVKIMIYLAVVAAALIVVCTLAGGGHDGH